MLYIGNSCCVVCIIRLFINSYLTVFELNKHTCICKHFSLFVCFKNEMRKSIETSNIQYLLKYWACLRFCLKIFSFLSCSCLTTSMATSNWRNRRPLLSTSLPNTIYVRFPDGLFFKMKSGVYHAWANWSQINWILVQLRELFIWKG